MHSKILALALAMVLMVLAVALMGDGQIAFAQFSGDKPPTDSLDTILEFIERLFALFPFPL